MKDVRAKKHLGQHFLKDEDRQWADNFINKNKRYAEKTKIS